MIDEINKRFEKIEREIVVLNSKFDAIHTQLLIIQRENTQEREASYQTLRRNQSELKEALARKLKDVVSRLETLERLMRNRFDTD